MNCPKCSTPAAAGATHCRRCGNPLTAKAAAASSAVPDEIDLMPMEPAKESSFSPYEPPPGVGGPPAPPEPAAPAAPGTKVRPKPLGPSMPVSSVSDEDDKKGKTTLIIAGVVCAIFVLFIGWRMLRPRHEIVAGKAKADSSAMMPPNSPRIENFEIAGTFTYKLEVNAPDSEISIGIFKRTPKDNSSLAALKKLPEGFEIVGKGETTEKTGQLSSGTYSWILVNEGKKPARAKFKWVIE